MVFYSSTKIGFLKSWTNIPKLVRFNLVFWQTLEQIYRKLKYRESFFGEFQGLPRFRWKMVLYSSTKFDIWKPWTNIPYVLRWDLGYWQASKQSYRKLNYRGIFFGKFESLVEGFLKKYLFILRPGFEFCSLLSIFNGSEGST